MTMMSTAHHADIEQLEEGVNHATSDHRDDSETSSTKRRKIIGSVVLVFVSILVIVGTVCAFVLKANRPQDSAAMADTIDSLVVIEDTASP
eukprot:CAMPEP_0172327070 /NCGR_PEP_ID=MMETSP1058-20130122/58482_1 /TAXON_ID=83371 /ORGANISM="Detonula confervacea, Strain CCMP 353" /LENGTH=90 /DNA_ID=CAMNT_0013044009 /DNA_START=50 /DNA_END=318 /DNA_ORIENTATION=+